MREQRKQQVRLHRTRSGVPGLFEGKTMVVHLTEEQFKEFESNRVALQRYVEEIDAELEDGDEEQ